MTDRIVVAAIDSFIREDRGEFSTQSLCKFLRSIDVTSETFDTVSYLKSHPLLFQVSENSFISRSSVFTNTFFSIKPTKAEIAQGILIPGHRCIPFVDPEAYPHELQFIYQDFPLKKVVVSLPISDIMETSFLYGEEYIPQLFTVDPANSTQDFAKNDYTIPNIIDTTVVDMKELYNSCNFSHGDRILAKVLSWDLGVIGLTIQKLERSTPFEITRADEGREQWFIDFDEALLHTIYSQGPLSSIEEQLAYTYYSHSNTLCTELCCSTEEYMNLDKSINIEYYGVESRLWAKGEEIPAIGKWNENVKDVDDLVNTLYEEIGIPIPFYMLDAYIFDSLFRKEKSITPIYNRIIPDKSTLDNEQESLFLLHIQERYDKLARTYNRFLDFEKGEVRSRSLELYSELIKLICDLDSCGLPVTSLPQQQLVIVSQLFSHTTKFLEAFMTETSLSKDDITMISTSLDGMNESFDDVSADLIAAMGKKNNHGFSII